MESIRLTHPLSCSIEAPCHLDAASELRGLARKFLEDSGLTEEEVWRWELVLAEGLHNAVNYCPPAAQHLPIRADVTVSQEWTEARVTDHTLGFDWPEKAKLPPTDSESGRGIYIMQNQTDQSGYLRGRGENCLILRKRRDPAGKPLAAVTAAPASEVHELRQTLDLMTEELASCFESLSAIFQFTAELQAGAASKDFIPRWLNQLLRMTEADWFVLRVADATSRELRVAATSVSEVLPSLPEGGSASPLCIESRAAAQRSDVWFDAASPVSPTDPLASLAGQGCGFAHPLVVGETLVGVLALGRQDAGHVFKAGQVSVIQTFADFLGIQIRNRQFEEAQAQSRLMARELEIAARIQRSLLPDRLTAFASTALEGFYRSAREVSGDYYDAIPTPDGDLLLVVADVMGKGLPPALFALMLRSLVRSRPDLASQPGEFLVWLNRNLYAELDRAGMFITVQLVFLDRHRNEWRVSGAGHPPLLVADARTGVTEVAATGLPLGILANETYADARIAWPTGLALMFTDGLIEARNLNTDLLGIEAVKSALAAAARASDSAAATQQRLASLLQQYEQGAPPADDVAFIVIAGTTTY